MKSKLIALSLFIVTAVAVALYPAYQGIGALTASPVDSLPVRHPAVDPLANTQPRIDVVFVLDTTGSMGGLIKTAKEKIWSIATTMASAQPAPVIRMGLVAYRDRGDTYVTRVVDLSDDLDSLYATLMDFQAAGGGDGPESVNQALHAAVHDISWNQDPQTYKVLFLVGDAPPHMDYPDDIKYPESLAAARDKGIVVNTIQCGADGKTTGEWRQIARLGQGDYFQVEQGGGAVAIATPFDEKLATLSEKLDETRLYYGDAEEKAQQQHKVAAAGKLHTAASLGSRARRAAFNVSRSGAANFLGEGELVDDVASGRVELSRIDRDKLPEPMQAMAPAAQQALIAETAERRKELKRQISDLAELRADYLNKKLEESGSGRDSLDDKLYNVVRDQAGKAGLHYEAAAPAY